MKTQKSLAVAVCLAFIAAATLVSGAATEQADPLRAALEEQRNDMLKTRAETAHAAYEAMKAAYEAETVTFDTYADALRKLSEAEVALATKPDEEIAALQKNVERTRAVEAKLKALYEKGVRGGEAKEYFSAKRDRETAEIMLLDARIRTHVPAK